MRHSTFDLRTWVDSFLRRIRAIQSSSLPRRDAKLARSDDRMSESIGRELESTQRILEPDLHMTDGDRGSPMQHRGNRRP